MQISLAISELISKLKETSGRKAKLDLVEAFPHQNELKTFIKCVYSTNNIYQSKIDIELAAPGLWNAVAATNNWFEAYSTYMDGERRGDLGARRLSEAYHSCITTADKELFEYVIKGEVKCGIAEKGWNSVLGSDTIFIPPYQRCSKLSQNNHLQWDGIICQTKEDAQFVNIVVGASEGDIEFYTRNWNLIECDITRDWVARVESSTVRPRTGVYMGEIYALDKDGQRFGREKSNGLVNGVIQTGIASEELAAFGIVLWDHVPLGDFFEGSCLVPYDVRFCNALDITDCQWSTTNIHFSMVKSEKCTDMARVAEIFKEVLQNKGEGVCIKNPRGIWESSDGHKDIVKIKIPMVVRMRVKGFNEADADSRHRDTFASINMESEDGRFVSAMSGMTDDMRKKIHNNRESYLEKVFECKCNGIQWNPEEPHSLYYLNFVRERDDVNTAHTFEDIKAVEDSAIESIAMV